MPFTKVGPNKYRSPSGKIYTKKQVMADGWKKKRNPSKPRTKVVRKRKKKVTPKGKKKRRKKK